MSDRLASAKLSSATIVRGAPDYWLIGIVAALVAMGTVSVYSASFVEAYRNFGDPNYWLVRHLQWAFVGIIAMALAAALPRRFLAHVAVPAYGLTLLLLAALLVAPSIAPVVGGARRWFQVGGFSFQPSELAKLSLVLFLAWYFGSDPLRVKRFREGFLVFAVTTALPAGLVVLEPDLGTAAIILATGTGIYFVAGAPLATFAILIIGEALALAGLAVASPYRLARITGALDPWADPLNTGFHTIQALLALGSGGPFGVGIGESRQKFLWLPAVHTDTIFAVIGEELGFLGSLMVLGLFVMYVYRSLRAALQSPDPFCSLTCAGLALWIAVQSAVNIAVVSSPIPFTGIPLPFVSYGGSSLVVNLAGAGILLGLSRYRRPTSLSGSSQSLRDLRAP